ncbi:hypothetical protein AUP68_12280 [Ilyonectria robusta]
MHSPSPGTEYSYVNATYIQQSTGPTMQRQGHGRHAASSSTALAAWTWTVLAARAKAQSLVPLALAAGSMRVDQRSRPGRPTGTLLN